MKFSTVALAASTAVSQTFLSNAAAPSRSTPFLPEAPALAGHRKLQVQGLTCDPGVGHVDCVDGFVPGTTTSCYAACDDGASCCQGFRACESFTGRVCKDGSCHGMQACYDAKIGLVKNSCRGPMYEGVTSGNIGACLEFGGNDPNDSERRTDDHPLSVGMSNSCWGLAACWLGLKTTGHLYGNIIDSCYGHTSCFGIAWAGTIDGDIRNSCILSESQYYFVEHNTEGVQKNACYGLAKDTGGYSGSITNSCHGENACRYAARRGRIDGGFLDSCNGAYTCHYLARYAGSSISKVWGADCCNTPTTRNPPTSIGCHYTDAERPSVYDDSHVPDACTAGTMDPTASPTTSPTVPGPLTLAFDKLEANFTAGASNELEVGFVAGAGRNVTVKVYETCDKGADEVSPSLFTGNVDASPDPTAGNTTHSKIIVGYNFNKAEMTNSSLWNSTSETLTFCQVTSLRVPDQVGGSFVILEDKRKIEVKFDLDADFEVDVNLGNRTIEEETEYINFDKDVEAYKCRGGNGNSFIADAGALPPNTQLGICIRVKNNTSVDIVRLANMVIDQDGLPEPKVFVENGNPKYGFTKMPAVSEGVIVKTLLPLGENGFEFESGLSLNISGTVDLKLATGRKLRALAGENNVAGEEGEVAEINVVVGLQSTADGFGPIGSSDGHAIVGKGLAAIGLMVLAVTGVVMM